MPATVSQIVSVVNNTETDINAEISSKNSDGWIAGFILVSGTDVIILFTKATAT